jgi:transitional endoplasmic reticulum ATPase
VIVVAATNRPELVDPALLRPGRFDLVVELGYPNEEERRAIFAIHTRGRPLAPDITMEELASLTEGRSGADIEAICRRAALLALREWISPRLSANRVQVTEEFESDESGTTPAASDSSTLAQPALPSKPFAIQAEHFANAIAEQRERYAVQEEAEDALLRKEAGRQRLLEMAADLDQRGKKPLRGFRLWLARLFGLV